MEDDSISPLATRFTESSSHRVIESPSHRVTQSPQPRKPERNRRPHPYKVQTLHEPLHPNGDQGTDTAVSLHALRLYSPIGGGV